MKEDELRLGFWALQAERCGHCLSDFDIYGVDVEESDEADFESFYECISCNKTYDIRIEIEEDRVVTTVRDTSGDTDWSTKHSIGGLFQTGHAQRQLVEELYRFIESFFVVKNNFERVFYWDEKMADRIPDGTELELPMIDGWDFLQTEVHNYLASAYSFDQIIESVRPKVQPAWDDKVNEKFERYAALKRVILGLRHYAQHEGIIPIYIRKNTKEVDRETDIRIRLDDIEIMESQLHRYHQDGYKCGADWHYAEIEGPYIDFTDNIVEHLELCGDLTHQVAVSGLKNRGEDIREYESYKKDYFDAFGLE